MFNKIVKPAIFGFNSEIILPTILLFVRMVDRNIYIVKALNEVWIKQVRNNTEFAHKNNIDEKTVRNIKGLKTESASLQTIINICETQGVNLSEFFQEAEKLFPDLKIVK